MLSILLLLMSLFMIIIFFLPIRIILHILKNVDDTRAKKQLEKLDTEEQIAQQDIIENRREGMNNQSNLIKLKMTAKRKFMITSIKLRRATLNFLLFLTKMVQAICSFSTVLSIILVGLLVTVAIMMSNMIPTWSLISDEQSTNGATAQTTATTASSTVSTSTKDPSSGNDAVKSFIYLKQAGFDDAAGAGMVGNWMQETGGGTYNFKPEIAGASGFGITQWMGSRRATIESKKDSKTLKVQVEFTISELKGSYKSVYDAINANGVTVQQAAIKIANSYEVGCGASTRAQYAQKFYDQYVKSGTYKQYE